MKGTLTIIPVEGEIVTLEITEAPHYTELQKLVGGYIEVVPAFDSWRGKPAAVFCDEEGKIRGKIPNARATAAWYLAAGGPHADVLCGDVVIVCGDDELMESL